MPARTPLKAPLAHKQLTKSPTTKDRETLLKEVREELANDHALQDAAWQVAKNFHQNSLPVSNRDAKVLEAESLRKTMERSELKIRQAQGLSARVVSDEANICNRLTESEESSARVTFRVRAIEDEEEATYPPNKNGDVTVPSRDESVGVSSSLKNKIFAVRSNRYSREVEDSLIEDRVFERRSGGDKNKNPEEGEVVLSTRFQDFERETKQVDNPDGAATEWLKRNLGRNFYTKLDTQERDRKETNVALETVQSEKPITLLAKDPHVALEKSTFFNNGRGGMIHQSSSTNRVMRKGSVTSIASSVSSSTRKQRKVSKKLDWSTDMCTVAPRPPRRPTTELYGGLKISSDVETETRGSVKLPPIPKVMTQTGRSKNTNASSSLDQKNRFFEACKWGNVNIVRIMLSEITSSMSVAEYSLLASRSLAMIGAVESKGNAYEITRFLLQNGFHANVRSPAPDPTTPLLECVKRLRHGTTPWVKEKDALGVLRLLLGSKADVNAKDGFGKTSLWWAAKCNNRAVVAELLRWGADRSIADWKNRLTPAEVTTKGEVKDMLENLENGLNGAGNNYGVDKEPKFSGTFKAALDDGLEEDFESRLSSPGSPGSRRMLESELGGNNNFLEEGAEEKCSANPKSNRSVLLTNFDLECADLAALFGEEFEAALRQRNDSESEEDRFWNRMKDDFPEVKIVDFPANAPVGVVKAGKDAKLCTIELGSGKKFVVRGPDGGALVRRG